MKTTNLQVVIDLKTKQRGVKQARKAGFNSLQDAIRLFVTGFASGKFDFPFGDEVRPPFGKRALRLYQEAEKERLSGEMESYDNAEDFMKSLK